MKKTNKRDTINLFFSAFLVIAFIVCAHFFSSFAATLSDTAGAVVNALVFTVFGLLVFYATRVGDGKAVRRFSLITLILMVIVPLYIIIASVAAGLPLHDTFAASDGSLSVITTLACVALGYGIPYSFISGFELAEENEGEENGDESEEEYQVLEGGIEADLADDDGESEETAEESEE